MVESLQGMGAAGGFFYFFLRMQNLLLGRKNLFFPADTKIVFGESAVQLPDRDIPYEDLFYRPSDVIALQARTVELVDRCYRDVLGRLTPSGLQIGEEKLNPEEVPHLEAVSAEIVLPREAMGLGDVKFMGAIGAFLGWKAVIFSLVVSSFIGAVVGLSLVLAGKRALSSRLPYGPYIALAAAVWIFFGPGLLAWYVRIIESMVGRR